ncbi:MAG: DUF2335 domain-containing protein [Nitrospirae bacterium]|nr:DUF2335 domain-containing protein [Nitrospirota bacterium]
MTKKIKKPKPSSLMATPSVPNRMPSLTGGGVSTQITAHSGPIPDPATLQAYEKTLPGLAERIVVIAENEQKYRHKIGENEQKHKHKAEDDALILKKDALNIDAKERFRGQTYGLIIAMAGLIASVISVSLHAQTTASIIGGTTVVGLVTVFVTGKLKEPKQPSKNEPEQSSPPAKV